MLMVLRKGWPVCLFLMGVALGWIARPERKSPLVERAASPPMLPAPLPEKPEVFPDRELPQDREEAPLAELLKSPDWAGALPEILARITELSADEARSMMREVQTMLAFGEIPRQVGETIMLSALSRLSRLDPRRAVRELAGLNRTRDQGATVIISSVAAENPHQAAALLEGDLADLLGPKAHVLAATLATVWAESDYDAAMEWSRSRSGRERGSALAGLIGAAFDRDPREAMRLFGELDEKGDQSRARWTLLDKWTEKDPQAALDFIKTSGGDEKEEYVVLFRHWAEKDLPGSLEALAKLDGGSLQTATQNVVEVWSRSDPQAAARWVAAQPVGVAGFGVASEAASAWALADPEAASIWVRDLPPGERREGAIFGLASSQSDRDAEGAAAWAEQLRDEAMRGRLLGSIFVKWRRVDPEAALSWLENTTALDNGRKAAYSGRQGK